MNTERLDWHVSLHHLQTTPTPNKTSSWQGHVFSVLENLSFDSDTGFGASFDKVIQRVNQHSGGYAEGDGSIGFVGPQGDWKIVGTLFEMQDKIIHVELMGNGPDDALTQLLNALDCPVDQCVVQILQAGFFIPFEDFRTWNRCLRST